MSEEKKLRDEFALALMPTLISMGGLAGLKEPRQAEIIVERAYRLADLMVKIRKK